LELGVGCPELVSPKGRGSCFEARVASLRYEGRARGKWCVVCGAWCVVRGAWGRRREVGGGRSGVHEGRWAGVGMWVGEGVRVGDAVQFWVESEREGEGK
jgi:hypothetical protein